MGDKSGIEWTDATWNPTTGCDRVSPGCDHCYALALAARLRAMGNPRYQRDGAPPRSGPGFGLTIHQDLMDLPKRWRKPRRVFVNSMSDLFHESMALSAIERVFETMALTPQHSYQVLTKRARLMQTVLGRGWPDGPCSGFLADHRAEPFPNIWLGVSVENQDWANARVPWLVNTPAAVRFLSCEPLLGPISLSEWLNITESPWAARTLDWVIVGGESGPKRRPFNPDWACRIRDQCVEAGVPFFYKQGSALRPGQDRVLDGRTWDEFPA